MPVYTRRLVLSLMAGGLLLGAGCDAGALAYFLMPEGRIDPKMKHLASEEKEVKVVILTWAGVEMRSEFIHADRVLSEQLGSHLTKLAADSKEKLTVVSARKVEEFKNNNTGWRSMDLTEVGRRFGADYVVYLEISSLSIFEPGSLNTLLRGRINLNVTLADVSKPDDVPQQDVFSCTYPGEAPGAIPVENESSKFQFRQMFLTHVARKLSQYFAKYPLSERRRMD